jgi:hypothetical protein
MFVQLHVLVRAVCLQGLWGWPGAEVGFALQFSCTMCIFCTSTTLFPHQRSVPPTTSSLCCITFVHAQGFNDLQHWLELCKCVSSLVLYHATFHATLFLCLLVVVHAQGSNDLQHWLDLRRHLSDSTIRLPGQYGSWPISGPAASMPFRAFRLLLLGPTQSHASPWAFCLSHWELYGYFYKLGSSVAAGGAAGAPVDANAVQGSGTGVAAAAAAPAAGGQGGVAAG